MNISESSNPSTLQQPAKSAVISVEVSTPVIRALDIEEIMLVAGGPEGEVGAGVSP